jgi:hypothetical protein
MCVCVSLGGKGCRPRKFAALGPGPFGPCVNTALRTSLAAEWYINRFTETFTVTKVAFSYCMALIHVTL